MYLIGLSGEPYYLYYPLVPSALRIHLLVAIFLVDSNSFITNNSCPNNSQSVVINNSLASYTNISTIISLFPLRF